MKKTVLHIAAHLGGGAGKAISGLAIGLHEYYSNKVILLEEPQQYRYVDVCKKRNIDVVITRDEVLIKSLMEESDFIIFSWWGHPLSLEVFKLLSEIKTRVFLWSHVNGLHYPYISPEFVSRFDGVMFTTACSYDNEKWEKEQCEDIKRNTTIVYGIGEFKPSMSLVKKDYNIKNVYRIGYSGTIDYNKMNEKFPVICKEIKKKLPEAEFYLYGKYDQKMRESFIEYDNVLGECVHFEGFVDDLEKRLAEMDVYCYPLNEINFATTENALLEAMAVGVPVVVLNNPPERSIISHGDDGMVANDTVTMVNYVVDLCKNRSMAKRLGEAARVNVITKYDCKQNASVCAQYINLFEKNKKREHDFVSLLGDTAVDNFLFFSNMTFEEYRRKVEAGTLDNIFMGESKGSVKHYQKYYNEDMLKIIC